MLNPTRLTVNTSEPSLLNAVRVQFVLNNPPATVYTQDFPVPPSPVYPLVLDISAFVSSLPAGQYRTSATGVAVNGSAGPVLSTDPAFNEVNPVLTSAVLS